MKVNLSSCLVNVVVHSVIMVEIVRTLCFDTAWTQSPFPRDPVPLATARLMETIEAERTD